MCTRYRTGRRELPLFDLDVHTDPVMSLNDFLARNQELIANVSKKRLGTPTEELQAERDRLLGHVLKSLKDQIDGADNARRIAMLETKLTSTQKALDEEPLKSREGDERNATLEKHVGAANDSLHHMALATKMYKGRAERDESVDRYVLIPSTSLGPS